MNISFKTIFTYTPLVLGVLILTIGAMFVPWSEVWPLLTRLNYLDLLLLLLLASAFYVSRIIRYGYMLKVLDSPMSFSKLTIAYFVAQPVSLLPAGEMYRSVQLKRQGDVPLSKGIPIVFIQSLTENIGLVLLALVSAIFLHRYVAIIVVAAVVYGLIVVALQYKKSGAKRHKLINKIPFVSIRRRTLMSFFTKNHMLLSGKSFVVLLLTSFLSSFAAIGAIHVAANGMGIELSVLEATMAFAVPTIIQNVTFLPGGIGVNEQGSVGILALFGTGLAGAVAITLIIRFITLVFGVLIGVVLSFARTVLNKRL